MDPNFVDLADSLGTSNYPVISQHTPSIFGAAPLQSTPSIFGANLPSVPNETAYSQTSEIPATDPLDSLPDLEHPDSGFASPQYSISTSSARIMSNAGFDSTSSALQHPHENQALDAPQPLPTGLPLLLRSVSEPLTGPITLAAPKFTTPTQVKAPWEMGNPASFHLPAFSLTPSSKSPHTPEGNALAFQKAQQLFKRNREAQRARLDQAASGSSQSIPRKRSHTSTVEEDREHMANHMHGEEDNSWMLQEPDEDDDELLRVTQKFRALNDKKKIGTMTYQEMMDLKKFETRLLQLNAVRGNTRVVEAENAEDRIGDEPNEEDPYSMFVTDTHETIDHHCHRNSHNGVHLEELSDGGNNGDIDNSLDSRLARPRIQPDQNSAIFESMLGQALSKKGIDTVSSFVDLDGAGKVPKKKRGPLPKDARERYAYEAKKAEKEREKELKKLQKKKAVAQSVASSKSKGKGKEKEKTNGKKSSAKKAKGKEVKNGESLLRTSSAWKGGEDDLANTILRNLAQNDPISERISNPIFGLGPEPELHGKFTKSSQFAKLYANIPEGASKSNAKDDEKRLLKASRSFGVGKVKAVDGKWQLKGMRSTLYHHQLLGAQWMVERELSPEAPHGGICADSMGLGKTIQSLAVMIGNPPTKADVTSGTKATLIVAPAAVVHQWVEEIEHHSAPKTFPKVMHYRTSAKIPISILQDCDVVVTSYHEVMKQFPFPNAEARAEIQEMGPSGQKVWWEGVIDSLGPLHKVQWYRVILDEAHAIKNNNARTSLACQNLSATHRWCLSGTPLMNRLEEMFPYLRFLRANFTVDFKTFQRYFCDGNSPDSQSRIATLLSFAMIRRTMDTTILGRAIITLPTPHTEVLRLQFSPAEKIIYRITEQRFRLTMNKFFKQGDAARCYSYFMVQLLRLRQLTSHPFMIEQTIREAWTLEDVGELKVRLSRLDSTHLSPFYEQVKVWVADRVEGDTVVHPFGKGDFGHSFEISKALDTLNEREMVERTTCGICQDVPVEAKKTPCHHIFCSECLITSLHKDLAQEEEVTVCPTCDKVFDINSLEGIKMNHSSIPGFDEDDSQSSSGGERRSKKRKIADDSKGIDMMGHEPWTDSTWVPMSDHTEGFPLTASVKTVALKSILLKGFHDAPMDKVVVYVQFRNLARIVARVCQSENWGFLYLTGDTSQEHRAKVISKFRSDPDAKILIAGLKCGGVGLNFPFANRCISLDLWWNHAVEQQSFGRLFRIGQAKETYFTRIAILNSVDMRLLTMQLHKLHVCDKAIRETGAAKPSLSLHELANLFGFLRTDADGNILSVEADYDDLEEWEAAGRPPSVEIE